AVVHDAGAPESGHWIAGGTLDAPRALRDLDAAQRAGAPLVVCGTAFAFVHLLEQLERCGRRYALPPSARVMETGGFQGRGGALSAARGAVRVDRGSARRAAGEDREPVRDDRAGQPVL